MTRTPTFHHLTKQQKELLALLRRLQVLAELIPKLKASSVQPNQDLQHLLRLALV